MALIDGNKVWTKNYQERDERGQSVAKNFEFHEALEDGTLPYLEIIAVSLAIDSFQKLTFGKGFALIRSYLDKLTEYLITRMSDLKHFNESRLVEIYRREINGSILKDYGPIVTFNLKNSKGIAKIILNPA